MARKCQITGKKPLTGFQVSHSHIRTKKVQRPNLQWKRIYVPEEDRFVRLRVSTSALRSITKLGLIPFLKTQGMSLSDVA